MDSVSYYLFTNRYFSIVQTTVLHLVKEFFAQHGFHDLPRLFFKVNVCKLLRVKHRARIIGIDQKVGDIGARRIGGGHGVDPVSYTHLEVKLPLPERALIFDSYVCECCGEKTGANWIRIQGGKKLCVDCCQTYDRFRV